MLYNAEDLRKALKDDLVFMSENCNFEVDNFVLDSREIGENTLFLAKKGEITDGHNFIKNVLENSKNAVVIADHLPLDVEKNDRIILVKNSEKAFEDLAKFSRARIKGKVIGITGSVGKTSTKEMLFHCLSKFGKTHRNIKSFNTYNGVLNTMINTPEDADFAIFEMGMNEYGEMDILRNFIKPNIAVILNVFPIHIGNFNSEKEIAIEKSKITDNTTETIVLNTDNKWYTFLLEDAKNKNIKNIISFAKDNKAADVFFESFTLDNLEAKIEYIIDNKNYIGKTKNLDFSMSYNFSSVLAVAKYLNLDINKVLESFYDYETYVGRNNIEKFKNLTLINGTYNANVKSFISGLELMNNIVKKGQRKVCIWADILELGDKSDEIHLELVEPLKNTSIDVLMVTGEHMKLVLDNLENIELHYFETLDDMLINYKNLLKDNDLVFVKSSHGSMTSKIVDDIRKNYIVAN